MSALEYSLAFGVVWISCLLMVMLTATAEQKGGRTLLERVFWGRACRMSVKRRYELVSRARESGFGVPSMALRDYLQREDVLYLASLPAHLVKVMTPVIVAFPTGFALTMSIKLEMWGVWAPLMFTLVFLFPAFISLAIVSLMAAHAQRRWTNEAVAATGRRAFTALLSDVHATGRRPTGRFPFNPPHVSAVKALSDFASALEKYALIRAVPGGRPMPEVVAKYAGAATSLRKLQSGLELDRVEGRVDALNEVRRILEVLASGRIREISAVDETESGVLVVHRVRVDRRKQFLALLFASLGVVAAGATLVAFGKDIKDIAGPVIGASAVVLIGAWVKWLRLPSEQGSGSPSGGSGGGMPNP